MWRPVFGQKFAGPLVLVQKFTLAWEVQAVIWGGTAQKAPSTPCIGVARIFGWGEAKPKITSNDVIRNFRKRNFLWDKQRYRRMYDQKPWPGLALNEEFSKERAIKSKVMKICKSGDVCKQTSLLKRITDGGLGPNPSCLAIFLQFFGKKAILMPLDHISHVFRSI